MENALDVWLIIVYPASISEVWGYGLKESCVQNKMLKARCQDTSIKEMSCLTNQSYDISNINDQVIANFIYVTGSEKQPTLRTK